MKSNDLTNCSNEYSDITSSLSLFCVSISNVCSSAVGDATKTALPDDKTANGGARDAVSRVYLGVLYFNNVVQYGGTGTCNDRPFGQIFSVLPHKRAGRQDTPVFLHIHYSPSTVPIDNIQYIYMPVPVAARSKA